MIALAKEAAAFTRDRKTLAGRNCFVIEPDGASWRLSIYPKKGLPQVVNGLTRGEANRRRLHLSSDGYIGRIAGDW